MEKKIILFLLILIIPFVLAEGVLSDDVYLGEYLKIDANYEGNGIDANALCSIFIKDGSDINTLDRLSDEYIDDNHLFSVDYQIEEPPLFRGETYTVKTNCMGIKKSGTFTVLNRRGIGFTTEKDIEFITKQSNVDAFFMVLVILFFLAGFFSLIYLFSGVR